MAQQLYRTHPDKSTVGCKELEDLKQSFRDLKTWLIWHYKTMSKVMTLHLHIINKLQQPKAE